jgi:hypothetical protein
VGRLLTARTPAAQNDGGRLCSPLQSHMLPADATSRKTRSLLTLRASRRHNYKLLLDDEFKERWKSQSDCVKTLGGNCPAIVMSFPHGFRCTPKELYVAGEKKGQVSCTLPCRLMHPSLGFPRPPTLAQHIRPSLVQVKKAATHERLRKFAAWLKQTEAPGLANPLIVFEFRHESWFCQDVYDIIQAEPRFVLAQLHVWSREDMSGGLWVGTPTAPVYLTVPPSLCVAPSPATVSLADPSCIEGLPGVQTSCLTTS